MVLFLLIGSPTAIQVASICQLNDVFEKEIAKICWVRYSLTNAIEDHSDSSVLICNIDSTNDTHIGDSFSRGREA